MVHALRGIAVSRLKPEWLVVGAAIVGVLILQALSGPRFLDDAYITFRYARSLSQGDGFVYNPGQRVQGTTTPLFTLLLALAGMVGGPPAIPAAAFGVALLADVVNTALVYRLARALLGRADLAWAAALVFLLHPLRLNVSAGGMETSLFILFLLGMWERALVAKSVTASAWLAALAALTRLDALLAVGPVIVYALWLDWRAALKAALPAGGLTAAWLVWAALYFGSPLPQSIVAKGAAYAHFGGLYTFLFLVNFLGSGALGPYPSAFAWGVLPGFVFFLFLATIGLLDFIQRRRAALVAAAYPLLYYAVMMQRQAPMFFLWYYPPLMPGLLFLLLAGLARLGRRVNGRGWACLLAAFTLGLLLAPWVLMSWMPGWGVAREVESVYQKASDWLEPRLVDGQVVFAPDIGVLGWRLQQAVILDPIGLVSLESMAYMDKRAPGELLAPAMIHDLRPDYVVSRRRFIEPLLNDPAFQQAYTLVWISEKEGSNPTMIWTRRINEPAAQ